MRSDDKVMVTSNSPVGAEGGQHIPDLKDAGRNLALGKLLLCPVSTQGTKPGMLICWAFAWKKSRDGARTARKPRIDAQMLGGPG